jgi:exonuclease VII small subunit
MEYSLDRYNYYTTQNKVIAVSTYAGRTVKGIAKCDPRDTFSIDSGKKIAAARCNEKVATKRAGRAYKKIVSAKNELEKNIAYYNKMVDYYNDSLASLKQASEDVENLVSQF